MTVSIDILNGCRNNKSTCQETVYQQYYGFMYSIGKRYIDETNDIKHLVNDSFFKAFTKITQYNTEVPFEVWLRRIMINTCIDFIRKNKKEKAVQLVADDYVLENNNTTVSINYSEIQIEKEHLTNLLLKVPDMSRKAFYLFVIDGYSHKEIGELLGINEGTSKWHISNARMLLKAQLTNYVKKNEVNVYAK